MLIRIELHKICIWQIYLLLNVNKIPLLSDNVVQIGMIWNKPNIFLKRLLSAIFGLFIFYFKDSDWQQKIDWSHLWEAGTPFAKVPQLHKDLENKTQAKANLSSAKQWNIGPTNFLPKFFALFPFLLNSLPRPGATPAMCFANMWGMPTDVFLRDANWCQLIFKVVVTKKSIYKYSSNLFTESYVGADKRWKFQIESREAVEIFFHYCDLVWQMLKWEAHLVGFVCSPLHPLLMSTKCQRRSCCFVTEEYD